MGLTTAGYTIVRIIQQYERIEAVDDDADDEVKIRVGLMCCKMGVVNVRMVSAAH